MFLPVRDFVSVWRQLHRFSLFSCERAAPHRVSLRPALQTQPGSPALLLHSRLLSSPVLPPGASPSIWGASPSIWKTSPQHPPSQKCWATSATKGTRVLVYSPSFSGIGTESVYLLVVLGLPFQTDPRHTRTASRCAQTHST